jgi:hypothetical protein
MPFLYPVFIFSHMTRPASRQVIFAANHFYEISGISFGVPESTDEALSSDEFSFESDNWIERALLDSEP